MIDRPAVLPAACIAVAGTLVLAASTASGQPTQVSGPDSHADWPSAAFAPNGELWVTWCAYDGDGADEVLARKRTAEGWGEILTVSVAPGDYLQTGLAIRPDGSLWVAWSAQVDGNFDIYARSLTDSQWSAQLRLTSDPQPDIHLRLAADSSGRLHLVWQSFRTGDANIYWKSFDGTSWSDSAAVTSHEANDWRPAIAIDSQDRVLVAYDSYRHGDYDVFLRILDNGRLSAEHPIADSPRFEARATVAVDRQDRAWVAWDDQGPAWALDMPAWDLTATSGDWGTPAPWSEEGSVGQRVSLRYSQKIGVAVFAGGQHWRPKGSLEQSMDGDFALSYEIPELSMDASGAPRLFLRKWVPYNDGSGMKERPAGWNIHTMGYLGSAWSTPQRLERSSGSNDQRMSTATDREGNLWVAYPSDDRWSPGGAVLGQKNRSTGRIRVARIDAAPYQPPLLDRVEPRLQARPYRSTAWTDRRHTVAAGPRRYELFWGDLHRHTEISGDGGFDGSLWDMYRYAFDAAELDFIAATDHFYGGDGEPESGGRSYDWWRTQKLADAFHVRGRFSPLFGYERSLRWPYGHRNVIDLHRGATVFLRTVPRNRENRESPREPDELRLWASLQGRDAITIPHTTAAGGGTNFAFNDPGLEPLMEIYQGCRLSYEASGAPRAGSSERHADGLAQSALAKGLKVGFIASSDHRSTHISYAAVYAEGPSREDIFTALRKRRAYAATDTIVLDFRAGEAIMGDSVRLPTLPELHVSVRGTGPLRTVQVIRNGVQVYTAGPAEPGARQTSFAFLDSEAEAGESYYYVRVQQEDGQLAWASPIWIDYQPE